MSRLRSAKERFGLPSLWRRLVRSLENVSEGAGCPGAFPMTVRYGATVQMKGGTATAWFGSLEQLLRWIAQLDAEAVLRSVEEDET